MAQNGTIRFLLDHSPTARGARRVIVDGIDCGAVWRSRRGAGWFAQKPDGTEMRHPERYRADAVYWLLNS